ncbi:MAG: hypothetical protein IT372_38315 [Polyangiaceae bacterium]|nr:hypothetical protein [Polyangiaceae bacterium]
MDIKNAVILGLRVAWELPQTALGAAALAAAWAARGVRAVSIEHGRVFVETRGIGISLGFFVFWFGDGTRYWPPDPLMKQHEHGHTFQSRRLGPAYLLLVGAPSVSRAAYAALHRGVTGRFWTGYFDGYPERQADALGGITPEERRAAIARAIAEADPVRRAPSGAPRPPPA